MIYSGYWTSNNGDAPCYCLQVILPLDEERENKKSGADVRRQISHFDLSTQVNNVTSVYQSTFTYFKHSLCEQKEKTGRIGGKKET